MSTLPSSTQDAMQLAHAVLEDLDNTEFFEVTQLEALVDAVRNAVPNRSALSAKQFFADPSMSDACNALMVEVATVYLRYDQKRGMSDSGDTFSRLFPDWQDSYKQAEQEVLARTVTAPRQ